MLTSPDGDAVTAHQFTWTAGDPGQPGTWRLRLTLAHADRDEVLTVSAADAANLQAALQNTATVSYDQRHRVLWFAGILDRE